MMGKKKDVGMLLLIYSILFDMLHYGVPNLGLVPAGARPAVTLRQQ